MRLSSPSDPTPARRLGWLASTLLALVLPAGLAALALATWPPLLWLVALFAGWPAFILLGLTSSARNNRWRRAWQLTLALGSVGGLALLTFAPTFGHAIGLVLPLVTVLTVGTAPLMLLSTMVERQVTDRPSSPVHTFGRLLSLIVALGVPVFGFVVYAQVEHASAFLLLDLVPPLVLAILVATWRPTRVRSTGAVLDSGAWLGAAWLRRADGIHWVSATEEREQRRDFRAIGIRPEMAGFSVDVPATEQPLPLLRIAAMALGMAFLPLMLPWLVTLPGILYVLTTGGSSSTLSTWLIAHHIPVVLAVLMSGGFVVSLGAVWLPFLALKAWVAGNSGGPLRLDGRTVRTAEGVFHVGQEGERIEVRTGLLGTALVLRNARQRLVLRGAAPELHGVRQALLDIDERGDEASIPTALQDLDAEVRAAPIARDGKRAHDG